MITDKGSTTKQKDRQITRTNFAIIFSHWTNFTQHYDKHSLNHPAPCIEVTRLHSQMYAVNFLKQQA